MIGADIAGNDCLYQSPRGSETQSRPSMELTGY